MRLIKRYLFLVVLCAFAASIGLSENAAPAVDRTISIEESNYVVYVGKQQKMNAVVESILDTAPKQTQLVWYSSDPDVAMVNAAGSVTGKKTGTATITASAKDNESISASATVEVRIPVQSVQINEKNVSVVVGGKADAAKAHLTVTVKPQDAFFQTGSWTSSNEDIATVDSNGTVTGLSAGTVNIVFTSDDPNGQKKAQTTVKVGQAVTEINVPAEEVVHLRKSLALRPEVLPQNATIKKLEFESSDPSVAAVSPAGQITGVSNGEATITCSATDGSGVSASVHVQVFQPVQSMKLTTPKINMFVGEKSEPLIVTITPEDAQYHGYKWTSSDESVATIDDFGKVKGISCGQAQITATSIEPVPGSATPKTATCLVTVTQAVEYISLEKDQNKSKNNKCVLILTVLPETATNRKVTWTSSNKKVATVKDGTITIRKGEGSATITAAANDGSGIFASCVVNNDFSGVVMQIGNQVYRQGTYTWSVGSFTGNGVRPKADNTNQSTPKVELVESNNDEILFRDIPWGSSYREALDEITVNGYWTPDYIDNGSYGLTFQTGFLIKDFKVAGHEVDSITTMYTYDKDENGHLKSGDGNNILYSAGYRFKYDKAVAKDLEEKLKAQYGIPEKGENGSLVWYGKNHTRLTMTSNKDSGISISYDWMDGLILRYEAESTYEIMETQKKNEQINKNKNNRDGL